MTKQEFEVGRIHKIESLSKVITALCSGLPSVLQIEPSGYSEEPSRILFNKIISLTDQIERVMVEDWVEEKKNDTE